MSEEFQQKVRRINELARKAKTGGLTAEEVEEREQLRRQYIDAMKSQLKVQLDSIEYTDEK